MRRIAVTSVLLTMVLSLMAGCAGSNAGGSGSNASSGGGGAAPEQEVVELDFFQLKVEIGEQLEAMIAEFEKEYPHIKIKHETVGGGTGYVDVLKAKFATGAGPDIFNNGGNNELQLWKEHLADLSDEPWVELALPSTLDGMTDEDGRIYGMPANMEGYGYLYNKKLFEEAGITELPKTLSELRAVSQQLKDHGITPFSNGYTEWWIIGGHLMNVPFAQQEDPTAYIQGLNDGTETIVGNPLIADFKNIIDLNLEFGQPNPLTTDYNTQVTLFASGQTAMVQQGNWAEGMIYEIDPNIDVGVLPIPLNDDPSADRIVVGVPNNWVINKNSEHVEEAKTFLNWMVTSEVGKRYMTEELGFIPAFEGIDASALKPLSQEIVARSQAGQTIPMVFTKWPDGVNREFSAIIQEYSAERIDYETATQKFQEAWDRLK